VVNWAVWLRMLLGPCWCVCGALIGITLNNALPDDGDCTETCSSCFNVNFNVNFKIVFKTIDCASVGG
jgi:hypothetical protein